jgi:hypothetical protein
MTHAFGGLPRRDDVHRLGSNTGRLMTVDKGIQPYTGQPLMGNVPVSVRAVGGLTRSQSRAGTAPHDESVRGEPTHAGPPQTSITWPCCSG